MELLNHEINYKRFSAYMLIFTILLLFFYVKSCRINVEITNSLQDSISLKKDEINALYGRLDSLDKVNLTIKEQLSQCQNEKFIESSKRQKYENDLQNFEDDCEHEKSILLLDNRINNSTDNELGMLLSNIGQYESLSDAERFLLSNQRDKGLHKFDTTWYPSGKKSNERREKNKSP